MPVAYPAFEKIFAIVCSSRWSIVRPLLVRYAPVRAGYRPVMSAARVGVQ